MDAVTSRTWLDRDTTSSSPDTNLVPLSRANPLPNGISRTPTRENAIDRYIAPDWFSRWIHICYKAAFHRLSRGSGVVPIFGFLVLYAAGYLCSEVHSPRCAMADSVAFSGTLSGGISSFVILLDKGH